MKTQNQIHLPSKKTTTTDSLGNPRRKLWVKSGNSTMLLCKNITPNAAKRLEEIIDKFLSYLDIKKEVLFLVTK